MDKISLIMLTWNSEVVLRKALDSVKSVVDEMIVVDSSSTDDTLDILNEYGCVVYTMELKDSWSKLKNFAIEKTSYDWILSLDSDEYLVEETVAKIPELVKGNNVDCYIFRRLNYLDNSLWKVEDHCRLFRKHCRFRGNIHECLAGFRKSQTTEVTIMHKKSWEKQKEQTARYAEFNRKLKEVQC